jgi:DNA-binding GntR family transcriptional regulator
MTIFINRTMSGRTERADQRGVYADVPGVEVATEVTVTANAGLLPGGDAAAKFEMADLVDATVRKRVAKSEDVAFQFSRTVFPASVVEAAPDIAKQDTGAGGFLSRLEDAGWELDHASELTFASAGDDPVSVALEVERGDALWREIWTVTDAASGRVLAVTESFYPADRVGFSFA